MDRPGMTKTEAVAALGGLAHLAGGDARALQALCLGMKALAREATHKRRNRASRTARGIAAYRTLQAAIDAVLQSPPMAGGEAPDNDRGAAPDPDEVRAVAADMRRREEELWQAKRPGFGVFAAAQMLDAFASRLERAVGDEPRPAAGSAQGNATKEEGSAQGRASQEAGSAQGREGNGKGEAR